MDDRLRCRCLLRTQPSARAPWRVGADWPVGRSPGSGESQSVGGLCRVGKSRVREVRRFRDCAVMRPLDLKSLRGGPIAAEPRIHSGLRQRQTPQKPRGQRAPYRAGTLKLDVGRPARPVIYSLGPAAASAPRRSASTTSSAARIATKCRPESGQLPGLLRLECSRSAHKPTCWRRCIPVAQQTAEDEVGNGLGTSILPRRSPLGL